MVDRPVDVPRRARSDPHRFGPGRLLAAVLSGWSIAGVSAVMCAVLLSGLVVSAVPGHAAAQGTPTPKTGGTLTAAISSDPVNLDPALSSAYSTFEILENVYNQLVDLDANLQVVPELAESWDVSPDKLSYTFHLRHGVKFHNGREMTADDVVYSLERVRNPDTKSGWAYLLDPLDKIQAVDPYTVLITTKTVYAPLLTKLTSAGLAIVPKEEVEKGDFDKRAVGTGPFKFVEFVPADHTTLVRNDDYWEPGLPYLDQIIYKPIPDDTVKKTNLETKNVDWVDNVPPKDVDSMMKSPDLVVHTVNAPSYWYLGVNLKRKPLDDKRVRQAISYAVDREELAALALYDLGVPSQTPIPEGNFWRSEYAPYSHDVDKAKELLQEAGVGDGFKTEFLVAQAYQPSVQIAEGAQSELADIGIDATIRPLEWSTWLDEEGHGNYDMYVCGWIGLVDPDDFFYAQQKTGQVFNFTGYSNPDLDKLLDQGRQELDPNKRKEIYDQVQKILIDDLPYIYLMTQGSVNAWQPYVKGYDVRPDSAISFKSTWLDK
jgi:peptide/nickel transport system substrate-binding protein